MPADETHPPDPDPSGLPNRPGDLAVLQYQVGAMQTAIDRGLGGLERAIDKGFAQITTRQDRHEERLKTIEERQAFDAARLKALEQFRDEQDRRDADRAIRQGDELARAVDSSQTAKTLRLIGILIASGLTAIGTVIAIIAALTGGFG